MTLPRGALPLLLVTALACAAGPVGALHKEQIRGAARLDIAADTPNDALALADTLALTLTVEGDAGLEVDVPRDPPSPTQWTLLRRSRSTIETLDGGRRRWRQTLVLAPLAAGKLTLVPPPLRYRDSTSDWQSAAWQSLEIVVTTEIKQVDAARLRDVTGIEEVPPSPESDSFSWTWIIGTVVLAALLAVIVVSLRRRRGAARVPAQEALRELSRLDARRLPEQGRGQAYVTLLSLVLRRYLERQFQLPARRKTTAEFAQTLADCPHFSPELRAVLMDFLRQSDLVKFASVSPSATDCTTLAAQVRRIIEESSHADRPPHAAGKRG